MRKSLFQNPVSVTGVTIAGLLLLGACQAETRQPPPQLVEQGQALSTQFVATLLPTLQAAMQQGGPVNAVEVCAVAAPRIAAELSEASGWSVTRVSLRARNQSSAVPDPWEADMLADFDRRQLAGEPVAQLNAAEVVNGEFRYLQAQAAGPLCLTCHGTDISTEVQSVLDQYYPQDMATGYIAGQIRGAISMRVSLD
ncbi:Tll0287-like domain-containing protein [Pseudohongiella sp.]|uniref:Tll0287-like domain-containing protein n=1 Tax=marine sediment metagenome TaxID=412755 RepID=A0A0F9W3C5_9ZZZZ|nr:DUF3365 domain-containing protein [Pseudohongiella sp.]HDZ08354.1 DUF3365 domain-containing protein [Pseudohongiella sp.]HEA61925.1 DUF3365 domain-containing protein [Pseudohongiella sp.]